jgi:hypothetical protein
MQRRAREVRGSSSELKAKALRLFQTFQIMAVMMVAAAGVVQPWRRRSSKVKGSWFAKSKPKRCHACRARKQDRSKWSTFSSSAHEGQDAELER